MSEKVVNPEPEPIRHPHNFLRTTIVWTVPLRGEDHTDKLRDVAQAEAERLREGIPQQTDQGDSAEVLKVELISTDGRTVLAEY